VANKNILFNYLEPENIESSIKNLIYWFNNDNETNLIIKIIIFYIYFLEIHPLSN
jgi:Fic family protein